MNIEISIISRGRLSTLTAHIPDSQCLVDLRLKLIRKLKLKTSQVYGHVRVPNREIMTRHDEPRAFVLQP
jgi:hypothetical protein